MAGVVKQSLDSPSETRTFDKGMAELAQVGGTTVGRYTFEPGWSWSGSVKPIVKTDLCQVHHVGVAVAGQLSVTVGGSEPVVISAGDAYDIPPGHDGTVVGDEPFISYEFTGAADYAKPS
jgi:hypothetical protein